MNTLNFLSNAASAEIHPFDGATVESLDHEEVCQIGRELLSGLVRAAHVVRMSPMGLTDIPVNGLSQLMNAIPGLRTLDPDMVNATDVTKLAAYVRAKEPALFEDIASRMSVEWPEAAAAMLGVNPLSAKGQAAM